jgi:hypothetical protein
VNPRDRILGLLAVRGSATQKEILVGVPQRVDRDEHFDALNALVDEGVIEIVSRRPAISRDGTAIGWKNTRYALTDRSRR